MKTLKTRMHEKEMRRLLREAIMHLNLANRQPFLDAEAHNRIEKAMIVIDKALRNVGRK